MTDGSAAAPRPDRAGWFDDPQDSEQLRYFDGILWTDHVTPRRTVWSPTPTAAADQSTTLGDGPAAAPTPQAYQPPTAGQDGPFGYPAAPGRGSQPTQPPHTQPGGPYASRASRHALAGAGPTTSDGVPLASMGARLGAWVIDSLITWTFGLVLGGYLLWRGLGNYPEIVAEAMRTGATPMAASELAEQVRFDLSWMGAFAVVQLLVGVAYHTVFLSRAGATPGKQVAGISVRLAERPGVISGSDALRRSMFRPVLWLFTYTPMLSIVALPLSIFDAMSGLWDPQRRTLHDKLGRTVVVQGQQPRRQQSGGH